MSALSFDTLLNLSLSYHTKRKTGELLRILSRSDAINDVRPFLPPCVHR
jgi:ABC-type transport system involved in Fe-S cluster assembly fused permease/ATPase subunit